MPHPNPNRRQQGDDVVTFTADGLAVRTYIAFEGNPGTYFRSTGWLERGKGLQQLTHNTTGFDESLAALILKYGEDDGRYLYDEMTRYRSQYRKLAFIETGLEADGKFIAEAATEAAEQGWTFERLPGELGWLGRLVDGCSLVRALEVEDVDGGSRGDGRDEVLGPVARRIELQSRPGVPIEEAPQRGDRVDPLRDDETDRARLAP